MWGTAVFHRAGGISKGLNFDIDIYLNKIVHPSIVHRLPLPIAHFLGYRRAPRIKQGNVVDVAWATLGAFCGVLLIEAFFIWSPMLDGYSGVTIIGSFGAAAILEYNTIESPLAQPRNSVIGHFISALTGVCITKLFRLSPHFEDIRWIGGALACSLACAAMELTKTTHPPAGATALLAAVDPEITNLGWFLLPVVIVSSFLMLFSALIVNNIQRQYPMYWWTPADVRKPDGDIEKIPTGTASEHAIVESTTSEGFGEDLKREIIVTGDHIALPNGMYLADEEIGVLEILKDRLNEGWLESVRDNGACSRRHSQP